MHTAHSPQIEQLARQRVKARLGFYRHAFIYVVVITGLGLLAFSQGKTWAVWPALGWGIGLLAHGLGVWGVAPGSALRERMVQREIIQLSQPH
jgi:hypothetical protein